MTTFVLVPGAWLGGWAWDRVTGELEAAGHTVFPVTLPGLAERAEEGGSGTDLEAHIDDVVALLDQHDLNGVILAGHSYAGIVVTGVADRRPDRVARVVYVDSGPAPDGVASAEFQPADVQEATRREVDETGDGWRLTPARFDPVDDGGVLAGLNTEDLALLRGRATDHPYATMTQPLRLTGIGQAVPRTAICCTFAVEQVRALIESGHPFFAELEDAELLALPTGHWPMLSEPVALAAMLQQVGG
jgi:pimeloyl-ACP methyl ester carboxylesterase